MVAFLRDLLRRSFAPLRDAVGEYNKRIAPVDIPQKICRGGFRRKVGEIRAEQQTWLIFECH